MDDKRLEANYPADSRFSEVEKIFSLIKLGKSMQVIGLPGVGRSNLLGLLSFNRNVRIAHVGEEDQTKFHFVLINFSEIKAKPISEVTKFMFLSLVDSLRLRNILDDPQSKKELETASSIFNKSVSSGDNLVIFNAFKRTLDFLALEKDLTIVFLLDRFEEYTPNASAEFFSNLRALRDRAKYKFSVVFSLKRSIEELLEPNIYQNFYEFFQNNTIYLEIEDKPSLDFRIKHLEEALGKTFSNETISETIKKTSGHGKLTRFSLENSPTETVLSEIWKSFTPQEQKYLKNPSGDLPKHLSEVGILKENKITIPIFEEYVKTVDIEDDTFIYEENKRKIKRGSLIISNGLTKLEFNLLKFLIQNENEILERDQIINTTWGEQKSTAGVTDQALDQLILRLRKKIEENPNLPKHIQTIKGRGLKFTQ